MKRNSDRAGRCDGGKVLLGVEDVVEEVRQGVHGHQRDDLDDVRFGVAGIADSLQIGVADLPAGLDDLARNWTAASRFGSLAWPLRARMMSSAGSLAICSAVKL